MSVYYETSMNTLPKSCKECKVEFCRLPLKKNQYELELKVKYTTKRHEECPLREIYDKEDKI